MKTSLILCAGLLLFSTAAVANPVMTVEELRAQAVGASHVKLSYTTNYGGDLAATYGTSQSPWVQAGSSTRDLGSGMQSMPIMEMCDCHVPTGTTLDYQIVRANGAVLVTAQVSGTDPTVPSTLGDCTTACQLADADAADAGITGTGGAPGPSPPAKPNGGGCAFLATGTSPVLLGLALLVLALAARRRRS